MLLVACCVLLLPLLLLLLLMRFYNFPFSLFFSLPLPFFLSSSFFVFLPFFLYFFLVTNQVTFGKLFIIDISTALDISPDLVTIVKIENKNDGTAIITLEFRKPPDRTLFDIATNISTQVKNA